MAQPAQRLAKGGKAKKPKGKGAPAAMLVIVLGHPHKGALSRAKS